MGVSSGLWAQSEWAARESDVVNAPCRQLVVPSEAEMKTQIAEVLQEAAAPESRDLFGLQLSDDPRLLDALTSFLERQPNIFDPDQKLQPQFQSSCTSVQCVLGDEKIFPNRTSTYLLYLYFIYGISASHWILPYGEPWTKGQLDDLIRGLNDFPAHVFPLRPVKALVRFQSGYTLGKPDRRLFGNAMIYLFDPWVQASTPVRHMTLFHEIAHALAQRWRWDESEEWYGLSGWPKDFDTKPITLDPTKFVSEYAAESPAEDFAETVVAYRYRPELLKSRNSQKYAFAKEEIFEGLEYSTRSQCFGVPSYSSRAQFWLQAHLPELLQDPTKTVYETGLRNCGGPLLDSFFRSHRYRDLSRSTLNQCLSQSLGLFAIEQSGLRTEQLKLPHVFEAWASRMRPVYLSDEESEVIQQEFRKLFVGTLKSFLMRVSSDFGYTFWGTQTSTAKVCADFSEYAYQTAEQLGFNEKFGAGDEFFSYHRKEFFGAFAREYCGFSHLNSSHPNHALLTEKTVVQYLASLGL